jgi:LysR family glycine cleavage system transcriptional activator
MRKIRPSLASLCSVEAAARRRSFSQAADELHVTHSAISHQIRQLEASLGTPLFTRVGAQMFPTAICSRLAGRLRQSLVDIDEALNEACSENSASPQRLELSVMGDFLNFWLVPYLADFSQSYPKVDLSFRTHSELEPPDPGSVDVGIWYRRVDERGFRSVRLLEDYVVAVCSPALRARYPALAPRTLPDMPLLRFALRTWREFFTAAGIEADEPQRGPVFGDAGTLLQAALAAQGVAMVREQMADPFLRSGALVQVSDVRLPANLEYFMSWREGHPREALILSFYDWLRVRLNPPGQLEGTGQQAATSVASKAY